MTRRRRATRPSTARAEVERCAAERDTDLGSERRILAWEVIVVSVVVAVMFAVRNLPG